MALAPAAQPGSWAQSSRSILAWDEGTRWSFCVDSTHAPVFYACVEDYHFDADGSDATLLRWTLAYKPRLAFKLARPLLAAFLDAMKGRGLRSS